MGHIHEPAASMGQAHERYKLYLRARIRAVAADRDLTISARRCAVDELVNAAAQFACTYHQIQIREDTGFRTATLEEATTRIRCCIEGVSTAKILADLVDNSLDEETVNEALFDFCTPDMELWGLTKAEYHELARTISSRSPQA